MSFHRGKRTRKYRSKLEALVATILRKKKRKFTYEAESFTYTLTKKYTPDFFLDDGILLEVKGVLMQRDREKMIAVRHNHPSLKIVFVFPVPHKKVPGLKSTHAEWAEKNGYGWTTPDKLTKKDLKGCLERT
tara:strand:- start:11860 stop:12255 length:396 start_codon:yes stop_codon:yes gene_type:complete